MKRIRAARTARFAVNPHAGWAAGRAAGSTGSLATTSAAPAAAKNSGSVCFLQVTTAAMLPSHFPTGSCSATT
eukprot:5832602-Alexandrium_andersonii.AAC.1